MRAPYSQACGPATGSQQTPRAGSRYAASVPRPGLIVVLLLVGCPANAPAPTEKDAAASSDADDLATRCATAIEHVAIGIYPDAAKPRGSELRIVTGIVAAATDVCVREGLTPAQAACLNAGTMDDALASVRDCLGDPAGWPSWFSGGGVKLRKCSPSPGFAA